MPIFYPNPPGSASSNDPIFTITSPDLFTRSSPEDGGELYPELLPLSLSNKISFTRNNNSWLSRYGIVPFQHTSAIPSAISSPFIIVGDNSYDGFNFEMLCGTYLNLPSNAALFFGINANNLTDNNDPWAGTFYGIGIATANTDSNFNFFCKSPFNSIKTPLSITKGPNVNFLLRINSEKSNTKVKIRRFISLNNIIDVFETNLVNGIDTVDNTTLLRVYLYTYSLTAAQNGFFIADIRYKVKR
jgi:hypothetical protein